MRGLYPAGIAVLLLSGLLASHRPALWGAVGLHFSELEQRVEERPLDTTLRQKLAQAYARDGFLDDAFAQYLIVLGTRPHDSGAREGVQALAAQRMPRWLLPNADDLLPLEHEVLELSLPDLGDRSKESSCWIMITKVGFPAPQDQVRDRLHKWAFPTLEYGYLRAGESDNWVMKARAHWSREEDAALAQDSLKAVLALCSVTRQYLKLDSAQTWRQPLDLWLAPDGPPGARSAHNGIYLYATTTPRQGTEWWRELAHEYGHLALPGVGGFAATDDAWANGYLGELLFPKLLAQTKVTGGMPWSARAWEQQTAARRKALIAGARAAGGPRADLSKTDDEARDLFLGLALWVEETHGPAFLAQVLGRCSRGTARDFVAAAAAAAKERGLELWGHDPPG
jgi:hypothetical protein